MSMFSLIKRGRQAAKVHREEQAKKEQEESQKPPYRHIPKHAAIDAMSGGPAGWREHDRLRIVEQNRRRSAMTASGVGMSGMATPVHPGMPRVHSALSHVSYPAAYASPVVQLPRNYSYSSMPPGWTPHSREMNYSPVDPGIVSLKGKEVERIVDSSRTSRSSSKVSAARVPLPLAASLVHSDPVPSPVGSSGGSTSSQDDLEMKPVVRHSVEAAPLASAARTTTRPAGDGESIHRLHPGRSRRISDTNQSAAPSRTPRASALAADVPPVPALPPVQFGTAITTPDAVASTSSSASSVTMVPVASSSSLAATGVAISPGLDVEEGEGVGPDAPVSETPRDAEPAPVQKPTPEPAAAAAPLPAPDSATKKTRRASKMTRFSELEPIRSNTVATIEPRAPSPVEEQEPPKAQKKGEKALPTSFDESALPAPKPVVLPAKGAKPGKLSKSAAAAAGGKLSKKNRWSLRSSKSTAVAV